MTGAPRSRPFLLLTVLVSIAGLATIAAAAIALLQGWDSDAAAPWRTAVWIGGALCAALGIGFAIAGGARR